MSNELKLRVLFNAIDGFTKPLRNMIAGNGSMIQAVKASSDKLKQLNQVQRDVGAFRELKTGLKSTSTELEAAQQRVRKLAASLHASGPPTKAMVRDFEKAKTAAAALKTTQEQQAQQLGELRGKLAGAGVETRNLAQHERDLRTNIVATTAAMANQQARLGEVAARERRLGDARARMNASQAAAGNMAVAGYATRSAGSNILGDLKDTVTESKKFESDSMRIKALGLGDHASADAIKFAKAMKSYGVSATDNISIVRDAMSIFADEHHATMVAPLLAKMKFANEAMFGAEDAHANEEKFMSMLKVIELRGGTKNEKVFTEEANMVQKVLTATGGRVGPDEWRNFIQTGGVAAKQMRKDAFFYQMEPLIQEMGGHAVGTGLMSAYSNVYQGKTTVRAAKQMMSLDLLDPKKVEYNKIGMIKQIRPGALAGGDLLKASPIEWLEKVLLPKFEKKGITEPDQVKDMISTIFTNRTASNLFTTMYMQREQIHKSERLSAGADNIDALDKKGKAMTTGRELEALAQMRELKREIGERVSPIYNTALQAAANSLNKLTGFMKEHATAAKIIITVLTLFAGALVVAGTLMIALAGVLGPLAIVRMSMTTLGMSGGYLARGLSLAAGGVRLVSTAVMFLGRALLMNPIGLAVTAIAVAALLIWKYWEPIKGFFSRLWGELRTTFSGGLAGIGGMIVNFSPLGLFHQAFAGVLGWFGFSLPMKFTEMGTNLITGLVTGITSGLGLVQTAISGLGSSAVGWFKEKLGIHSPSRVFAELGGYISAGAAVGMSGDQAKVAKAAAALAAAAVTGFAAPQLTVAANLEGPVVRAPAATPGARNLPAPVPQLQAQAALPAAAPPAVPVQPRAVPAVMPAPMLQFPVPTVAPVAIQRLVAVPQLQQPAPAAPAYVLPRPVANETAVASTPGPARQAVSGSQTAPAAAPAPAASKPLFSSQAPIMSTPASQSKATPQAGNNTVTVNVYGAPGMDVNTLARAVATAVSAEFDRRDGIKRARTGSRLTD